jgi:hypothetical protein
VANKKPNWRPARRARAHVPGLPSDALRLCRALLRDDRLRHLTHGQRLVLIGMAVLYTDRDGRCRVSLGRIAADCGVSRSTAVRAIAEAHRWLILDRHAFARPDGRQGASIYKFSAALVGGSPMTLPAAAEGGETHGDSQATHLNGTKRSEEAVVEPLAEAGEKQGADESQPDGSEADLL